MKRIIAYIILGVVVIGLLVLNIWFSTYCYNLNYTLYLNEFNAQISQFGFYKEDVHMLNQINEYNKFIGLLIVNVVNYFIIIIGGGIAGFAIYDFFDWC
jgi:hypothetical protein